ncbi:hypothetical protein RIR_jg12062.t1 [Rhizophagus irregularis DAOM 181602=DAOM 197198]|nr:hypothetical protein RIR_jg12062.t1 [Rhizophagus irregularis DAOM 181602=DAOM 197198]
MILDGMHIINNTVIEWEGNISISPTELEKLHFNDLILWRISLIETAYFFYFWLTTLYLLSNTMGKPSKSSRDTRLIKVRNNLKNRLQLQERKCKLIVDESINMLMKAQQELQEIKKRMEEQEKRVKLIQERVAEREREQEEERNNVNEKLNDEANRKGNIS